jgi:hypothetical protein
MSELIARVRFEIGDTRQLFRSTGVGDGETVLFDLPRQEIDPSTVSAEVISGADVTALEAGTGFTLYPDEGKIALAEPAPLNSTLLVTGHSWAMFSDDDLYRITVDSLLQHTYGQETEERYRDMHGFISFRETPKMLQFLPAIEEPLVVMLTVINVFWSLANDAATDANVQTAEGTSVDRTTRYEHLMGQIQALTQRYTDYCAQLNVGLYRWETLQLRRSSRTTGRLVPLFRPREYDDHRWPVREIPAVDHRNDDVSGVPSPLWTPNWGT